MPFFPSTVVPSAHSIDPPPVLDAGHLVFPVFLEHFYPVVSAAATSGFPLLRPGRSVPGGVGGNAASYQGPWHLGVAPSDVQAGGLHHPPAPIRALGTWGQAGAVGPSRIRDCPCTGWCPPEVPHQCPRMGLGWSAAVLSQWMAWRQCGLQRHLSAASERVKGHVQGSFLVKG